MPERYLGKNLGNYRVDALVGSGGFAWVYKGFDPELGIPVALKVLKPQYAGDPAFEERFRREASIAARLRHPNIIKIYAVGREGDAVYFAMDFLPHGLADRLEVMTTLPEQMLLRVGVDVASALGFAHREGVIHRDIKVDNILFDDHGNAIVADFGIARAVSGYSNQTGSNMVVGTPQYFSPEQARGLPLDGRADIYSLGVTLFKAATGTLPFNGDDWYEIARQHVEEEPPDPRSINSAVAPDVADVILRCLEKEPDDRFESGEQLCAELAILLEKRGGVAATRRVSLPPENTAPSPLQVPRLQRRLRKIRRKASSWVTPISIGILAFVLPIATGALVARVRAHRADDAARAAATVAAPNTTPPAPPASVPAAPPPAALVLPPGKPQLSVIAPATATVTVNGKRVARGNWRSDSLAFGSYEVAATVDAPPTCRAAKDSRTVQISGPGVKEVRLSPKGCGALALDAEPVGATFTIRSLEGGASVKGQIPMSDPVVVTEGLYRVTVEAPMCAQYNNDIRVGTGSPTRVRVRLICQKS